MVFTSPVFLFLFFPFTIILYGLACTSHDTRIKNGGLLFCSVLFYAFSGLQYLLFLFLSILINWWAGIRLGREKKEAGRKKIFVIVLIYDIAILAVFKYLNLLDQTFCSLGSLMFGKEIQPVIPALILPVGISFFTFQIMSYLIDVYRRKEAPQTSLTDLALYIMLFPQLIAGPIVRYSDISGELRERSTSLEDLYIGIKRFMVGFMKKTLFANPMGSAADLAFRGLHGKGMAYAWAGILCYSLQIYLDFSAYSDMAIGLGRMFGFHFLENFNYPYISKSVSEFWRRWHISLSSWFRDYVYIPLGGNRNGISKTCRNLMIVFALTGLWHGSGWNYLFWGVYFGCLLVAERLFLGRILERLPDIVRHFYTLMAVGSGWIFFRSRTMGRAFLYFKRLFTLPLVETFDRDMIDLVVNRRFLVLTVVSVLLCTPFFRRLEHWLLEHKLRLAADLCLLVLFFLAVCEMMGSGYNPFIYFRF